MSSLAPSLADPEIFLALEDLELAARGLADTVWLGHHGSILRGSGVEFHSHRGYERGDDLRLVNWTLYARHRKLFVRESRQESRRPVYLLIDSSASMGVKHGPWSKFHYASRALAALAHLAAGQGDAPAFGMLAERLESVIPARTGAPHVAGICAALGGVTPSGTGNPAKALLEARHLCRERGFVVFVSDFFENEDVVIGELAQLRAQGHDVLALQVLDPVEVELPATGDFEFLNVEDGKRMRGSAEEIRMAHARLVANWRAKLRTSAIAAGLRWESVTTAEPLAPLLRRWLG